MRQISMREFKHKLSVTQLKEWLPCQIVSDGEVVAVVRADEAVTQVQVTLPPSVAHLIKHGDELPERRPVVTHGVLPFDKRIQASKRGFNG